MEITLIGAGRHPHTKELRRRTQPRNRTFWIGPLFLAPQKRFNVDEKFCAKHYPSICNAIGLGVLLVQHEHDKFVNPDELKILCFGSPKEVEDELKRAQEAEEAERAAEAERVRAETEAALQQELASEEDALAASQAEPELSEEEQNVADLLEAAEDLPEGLSSALGAGPSMVEAIMPATPVDPETTTVELEEGWEGKSVPELLDLAEQLGAEVKGNPSRKNLTKAIRAKVG